MMALTSFRLFNIKNIINEYKKECDEIINEPEKPLNCHKLKLKKIRDFFNI